MLIWLLAVLMGLGLGRSRRSMRGLAIGVAVLGSLTMSVFAIRFLVITVAEFSDPCIKWGSNGMVTGYFPPPRERNPDDPCANRQEYIGETKAHRVGHLLILPGGVLLATVLGLAGTFRRTRTLTSIGAVLMFLLVIPLCMSVLMPVAGLTGAAFMAISRQQRNLQEAANRSSP